MSLTSEEYIEQLSAELGKLAGVQALGTTYALLGDYVAPGSVALKGQSVTRAMYADALAWAQENQLMKPEVEWQALKAAGGDVPWFSEGDGTSTMRFPYVPGRGMFVFGVTWSIGEATAEGLLQEVARISAELAICNRPGFVKAFAANTDPEGYLLCNGAEVSRTTYAALFAEVGTTYGAGDGSTTFNIPDMTDRFIQGSGTAGTVKEAGAPNITGTFFTGGLAGGSSGAFGTYGHGGSGLAVDHQGSFMTEKRQDFYASNSNAIYGSSETVQPPAVTMRFYIKY